MGRRYYCDYCNRAFTDVIESRKKHLKGVTHERLKKIYFNKVRDLKTLVEEERQKDSCRRFRNTGSCPFEEACTFTHYSPQELSAFEFEVKEQEKKKRELSILPSIQDWIQKKTGYTADNGKDGINICEINKPLANYSYPSLPPSLQPISFRDIENMQFLDWG